MTRIKSIDDIESIKVHWSESCFINEVMKCDENSDIEKEIEPSDFNDIVKIAATKVESGSDKTSLTVILKNGNIWCSESKFYLNKAKKDLISLLNAGE